MNAHVEMISRVAESIGPELLPQVAFVGGCATGLLITDAFSKEQVRHTDDVDLIVHIVGVTGIYEFERKLSEKGFTHDTTEGSPICTMLLGELRVDFMPDTSDVFGFTNRWYAEALRTAVVYTLPNKMEIRLVRADYFLATKFEAYKGRGDNDPLGSRDIEDILMLIDGRAEIVDELRQSPAELFAFIKAEFSEIIRKNGFSYAVTSASANDQGRENKIFSKIEEMIRG